MGTTDNNNKKVCLLNSPRLGGKGELCKYIRNILTETMNPVSMQVISCKDKLYALVMELFCLPYDQFWGIYGTRELKEVPLPEFRVRLLGEDCTRLQKHLGYNVWKGTADLRDADYTTGEINLSVRESMIYVSEVIAKPRMGVTFFGDARAKVVVSSSANLILDDSSSAFNVDGVIRADEVYPLIDAIGQENILLLRIHREGFDFTNDSRRYIPDGVVTNTVDVYNNGTEGEFLENASGIIFDFIGGTL